MLGPPATDVPNGVICPHSRNRSLISPRFMPAWQVTSITDVASRIREEGGSTTNDPKRQRTRSALIVAETMQRIRPLMEDNALSSGAGRRQLLTEIRRLTDAVGL